MPYDKNSFKETLKQVYKSKCQENRRILKKQIEDGSFSKDKALNKKIDNFCKKHNFDKNTVIKELKTNEIIQAFFAKDPTRQNIYEKVAGKIIQNINGVENFKNLPNNSLYLIGGVVINEKEKTQRGFRSKTKTIDFKWRYAGKIFYASHKYTRQEGGNQDNQYDNLKAFIAEANESTKKDEYFIAIADGAYYQKKRKINALKAEANKSKGVYACTTDELEQLLLDIKKKSNNA